LSLKFLVVDFISMANSIIKEKSYSFALQIIKLCAKLKEDKNFVIATQLLKAGTSIGANVEETLAGQSRKDFFAKMSIASKEARETNYWLRLLVDSKTTDVKQSQQLITESEELIKILTSIVKTGCKSSSKLITQN
jgi:four helix bundle protein